MKHSIKRGLDIGLTGSPRQEIQNITFIYSSALLGSDYLDLRPEFRVDQGSQVVAGQTLFVDRKRPDIHFVSPVTGSVAAITRGHRRRLDAVVLSAEGDAKQEFAVPGALDRVNLTSLMCESGLWTALRARPFDVIPDPGTTPFAIFVTAMESKPNAADASVVIASAQAEFDRGLAVLPLLTNGEVHVCHRPAAPLSLQGDRIKPAIFDGPHPSGLPGTHIHFIAPASIERPVWHIGYQDVIALGHLLGTGTIKADKVIALGGPGAKEPRLLRVTPGVDLDELVQNEVSIEDAEVLSGSILAGKQARYLGRYDTQVTLLKRKSQNEIGSTLARFLKALQTPTIVPLETHDAVMPLGILAGPLMRALAVGDAETAKRLGCLELCEDDVALLSHVCPSGNHYGHLLRNVLNELKEQA